MLERALEKAMNERDTMRITHHLPKPKEITLEDQAVRFCKYFGLPARMLFMKSNKAFVIHYRRLFIALNYEEFGPKKLGKFLGFDHSTMIHHLGKHEELIETDKDYEYEFLKLKMLS